MRQLLITNRSLNRPVIKRKVIKGATFQTASMNLSSKCPQCSAPLWRTYPEAGDTSSRRVMHQLLKSCQILWVNQPGTAGGGVGKRALICI